MVPESDWGSMWDTASRLNINFWDTTHASQQPGCPPRGYAISALFVSLNVFNKYEGQIGGETRKDRTLRQSG